MMRVVVIAIGFGLVGLPVQAKNLTLVEGTACAYLSQEIEKSGDINNQLLNEISDADAKDGKANRRLVDRLSFHRDKLVDRRSMLISDYQLKCSTGQMSYPQLRQICTSVGNNFDFSQTVFCKPYREAE